MPGSGSCPQQRPTPPRAARCGCPPGRRPSTGAIHPLRRVERELVDIFIAMGYEVYEGREVEDDYHCFEALNMPPDHPARDMQDTFWLKDGHVLRTHTSPVQIRVMKASQPPFKVIANDTLLRVAAAAPGDMASLRRLKGITEYVAKRFGRGILGAVERGV